MSHVEDEDVDDFLYGDSGAVKNEAQDATDNQMESDKTKEPNEEEEDELYGLYRGGDDNEKEDFIVNDAQDQRDDDGNEDDQSDTNDVDDSDDDVEIILDAEETEQPAEGSQSNANPDPADKNSLVNIKPNATGKVVVNTQQKQDGTTTVSKPAAGAIDLDAVGQLDGKPITDVELDSFEDKPWRKPGADITDYFNYGFNESTWRTYCNKQKILREGKGKMMGNMDMPPDMAAMGMMMPPMMDPGMGGMPPNPMMGLPMGMPMNMQPGGGNPNFRPGRPNGPSSNQGQGQGRNNNRGSMPMGRMRGSQDGGGDDKSNTSDNGDEFNPDEQHMNFPMNFPGAPPMGMFPPDMGPGGPMGGMPPFFNPNMAGPGGQMGFDGPGRGNPMMMMRGGGPMRPSRGRGSPAPGDHGSPNNDPRKRVIPPDDDPYNKRPRNR